MKNAANRASMSHEMETENRGVILAAERGNRAMPPGNAGRAGRNAFQEPDSFQVGPHGRVGGNDPMNTNDWDGDFDDTDTEYYGH